LLAALLAAVHFPGIRNAGAAVQRDYRSRRIVPRHAGFRGDAGFLHPHRRHFVPDGSFFIFLLFGVAAFIGLGNAPQRKRNAHTLRSSKQPAEERRLSRALSLAALSVALGSIILGGALFFIFPRFTAGYLGRASMQPSLMTGFSDDVELGQIGEIKKKFPSGYARENRQASGIPMLRWRGPHSQLLTVKR